MREPTDSNLGRVLGGNYRIDALIGSGGMGVVYRGVQLSVNRPVAIKFIKGSGANHAELLKRFRREAEATARLSHVNTVRLYDFGATESDEFYIVMEHLDGVDLSAFLGEQQRMPLAEALPIVRQVLLALTEAHALGIFHRDLKPSNVFLTRARGEVVTKVMDFGIAGLEQTRQNTKLTRTGSILGTPAYMSPEQAHSRPVDARSDLYALGVMLFEMLSGRLPFEADTELALLVAHTTLPPLRLSEVAVHFPERDAVQRLLDGLLAKAPDQRPASAAIVIERIDELMKPGVGQEPEIPKPPVSVRPYPGTTYNAARTPAHATQDETGRGRKTSWGRVTALVVAGALLALAGFGVGNTTNKRTQIRLAVQDGKDIYAQVNEVTKPVDTAKQLVQRALGAATGGAGRRLSVDFQAIEQLAKLKRPFSANEFHRRLYRAFGNNVVDELFDYYNNINLLWDGFTSLGAKTAGAGRREALQKSASATEGLLSTDYGMVLSKTGETFAGGLVYVNIEPQAAGRKADERIIAKVSSNQGGQEVERTLYTGQSLTGDSVDRYTFLIDKVRSRTILSEGANLFAKYRADLLDLSARLEKTIEVQGRLIKDLGPIASMRE